jgi:putative phosphoesterase
LVVSDSHGETDKVQRLFRKMENQFDILIHLGDGAQDLVSFEGKAKTLQVRGNMDENTLSPFFQHPLENVLDVETNKIWLLHGHSYNVHLGLPLLKKAAREKNVRVVLFGHTHKKDSFSQDGILYFNPGAMKNDDFGLIKIDLKKIESLSMKL